MNKQLKIWSIALSMLVVVAMNSCKDDPALPDNLATFEAAAVGFEGTSTEVKVAISRSESADLPVVINLAPTKIVYGTDFTTEPAAVSNKITLVIPAGSTGASIKVNKLAAFLNGDETIDFTIESVTLPVLLGEVVATKLSFSAITSDGATLTLTGKTDASNYTNAVYADLSGNKQTPVDRKSWILGFYGGSDFKVILNHAYQASATATTKTDITAVVQADADAIAATTNNLNFSPGSGALGVVDYWDGDLTKTVFASVSATDSENKVYLVSVEGSKTTSLWFKVKVNRNGTGYRVSYARVGETTIKTLDVAKNADYNFTFASLETDKVVSVEPLKKSWDISWSYSTYNAGNNTPYWYQDFVTLNYAAGAEAAEVVSVASGSQTAAEVSAAAYTSFNEASLTSSVTFKKTRDAIGSNWRVTTGSGILRDRFYVVKDPSGNIYKLKFISMGVGSDGGVRGNPVIEYKLVKKAS